MAKKSAESTDTVSEEQAQDEMPEFGKHILVEGSDGSHSRQDAPEGWNRDFRVVLNGQAYDHVGQGENGVWVYRRQ